MHTERFARGRCRTFSVSIRVGVEEQVLLPTPTLDADVFNPGARGMCVGVARSTPCVDDPPQKHDCKVITASCL